MCVEKDFSRHVSKWGCIVTIPFISDVLPEKSARSEHRTYDYSLNKLQDALKECDRALQLDNKWARAYRRKASILLKLNEPAKAAAVLKLGLAEHPADEDMKSLQRQANEMSFTNKHAPVQASWPSRSSNELHACVCVILCTSLCENNQKTISWRIFYALICLHTHTHVSAISVSILHAGKRFCELHTCIHT